MGYTLKRIGMVLRLCWGNNLMHFILKGLLMVMGCLVYMYFLKLC